MTNEFDPVESHQSDGNRLMIERGSPPLHLQ
jgi:hypothetical protein